MFETMLTEFGVTLPPTQAELPYNDGNPMESQRHKVQMDLLLMPVRNLMRQGMTIEQVARLTGLSEAQVQQLGS